MIRWRFYWRGALALTLALGPVSAQAEEDAGAYLAARVAAQNSDFAGAALYFTRAMLADPSNQSLQEGALLSQIAAGHVEAAIAIARPLPESAQSGQVAALALLADEAARGDYAAMIKRVEKSPLAALLNDLVRGWAALGTGRMSEAQEIFDQVAQKQGVEPFGFFHKALALASVGDFEGAEAIFAGPARDSLHGLRRAVIAHAQILSQLERRDEALALLDASAPEGRDAEIDGLRARLRAGETLPFDIVTSPKDGVAEVFFTLATALEGEAEDAHTLAHTQIAAWLRPDHTESILLSAGLLARMGQPEMATETYARIPPESPSYHVAEIGRAGALESAGQIEAAIEVMTALAKTHGQIRGVQGELGTLLRQAERFEAATAAYDAELALRGGRYEPGDWTLFFSRGICHERQKRWPEAEADFRKALALSPDQPHVLNYLGYSFLERNENLEEALAMIERAVKAEPQSGHIIDSLAWAYFRLGRYEDALAPMEHASLLEPVDPVVTDHLGDVYWAVGRQREARFQWRRALSFGPEEKDAPRIRRKLEIGLDGVLAEEGAKPLLAQAAADDH